METSPIDNKNRLLKSLFADHSPDKIPLDLGACAIAIPHQPEFDVEKVLKELERLAEESRKEVKDPQSPISILDGIRKTLFSKIAFQGNHQDYYAPENSFIDAVLESKRGIPITLSVIMIEVGRRLGIELHGIGLPCHFLVGHHLGDQLSLYDPYYDGDKKTIGECVEMVHLLSGGNVTIDEEHFTASSPRSILIRMLMNLRGIYRSRQKTKNLIAVLEQLLIIGPEESSIHGELAANLATTGDLTGAHHHLEKFSQMVGGLSEDFREADWVRRVRANFSTYN